MPEELRVTEDDIIRNFNYHYGPGYISGPNTAKQKLYQANAKRTAEKRVARLRQPKCPVGVRLYIRAGVSTDLRGKHVFCPCIRDVPAGKETCAYHAGMPVVPPAEKLAEHPQYQKNIRSQKSVENRIYRNEDGVGVRSKTSPEIFFGIAVAMDGLWGSFAHGPHYTRKDLERLLGGLSLRREYAHMLAGLPRGKDGTIRLCLPKRIKEGDPLWRQMVAKHRDEPWDLAREFHFTKRRWWEDRVSEADVRELFTPKERGKLEYMAKEMLRHHRRGWYRPVW